MDGPAYRGAPEVTHEPHVVGNMAAHIVLPWVHRVFSNLKRWALGVYHGLRPKHLQSYLDEFVFREIQDLQPKFLGKAVNAVVFKGRLGRIAPSVGFDDRDAPGALLEDLTNRPQDRQ